MLSTPLISCSIGVATVCGEHLGRGAGIGGADADGGRRDLGIFRDRQRALDQRARERQDDREDRREDRPVDEEMRKAHRLLVRGELAAGRMDLALLWRRPSRPAGRTDWQARRSPPGRSASGRWRRRAGRAPCRRASPAWPTTLLSSPTVSTILRAWSDTIAVSGISSASSWPPYSRSRPNMPGVRKWSLFSKIGAAADRAGLRVDLVVDEIHHAAVRPVGLVGEPHLHRIGRIARRAALPVDAEPACSGCSRPPSRRTRSGSDRG